jgi:hypothetical protein
MMIIAYTVCDTGHRWFTALEGVCISYDKKLIQAIIAERHASTCMVKEHVEEAEKQLRVIGEQQSLPPIVDSIMTHNRKTVQARVQEQRRFATAEAVVNDALVRDVMYFDNVPAAMAYTAGTARTAEEPV